MNTLILIVFYFQRKKLIRYGSLLPLYMQSKEQIENIGNMLLPGFLPKDKTVNELSFHFTIPPSQSYKVWYQRKDNSTWEFVKYEEDER